MGFIKAFAGAIGGTFADQWKEYIVPMSGVPATAGIYPAVAQGTNAGRGENTKGSNNIISNGSKIVVPEGMALITMQEGAITGCITEAGGFTYTSDDPNAQSIFAGDGVVSSLIKQSWERVKFGGQPGSQQLVFYVNLKEIPGNRFGTQGPVRWHDTFFDTQVGAVAKGTYSLKIVDPLLFVKNFVPGEYLASNAPIFDFADMDNDAGNQLFNEFVSCLPQAFAKYTTTGNEVHSLEDMRSDSIGIAKAISDVLNQSYNWKESRGLEVTSVAMSMDYDEATTELMKDFQQDDREIRKAKRMGEAYGNNMAAMMAAASGQAMQSAAANENGAMMGFMGMNMAQQNGSTMMGAVNNNQQSSAPAEEDPMEKLAKMKKMLDEGLITQEDYDKAKEKILGG